MDPHRRYWEASRRVRATFAKAQLSQLLHWTYGGLERVDDDELASVAYPSLAESLSAVEPAWAPVADTVRAMPVAEVRAHLQDAFARIRGIARAVATKQATPQYAMTVALALPQAAADRDGLPRWWLQGELYDAIIWMAVRLFSEVPRSLIRLCQVPGCETVYAAEKNQRYCVPHQRQAHRQKRREAERARRAKQRAAKARRAAAKKAAAKKGTTRRNPS